MLRRVRISEAGVLPSSAAATFLLWAAASRAVRTPSESEGKDKVTFVTGAPTVGPGGGLYVPTFFGNARLESEVLWAYELGYRIQPTHRINLDLATFYHDYSDLVGSQPAGFVPGSPASTWIVQPFNTLRGEGYGGEAAVTIAFTESWRVSASYSLLLMHVHGEPVSTAESLELNAPTHQAVVRSSHDFSRRATLDAQLRYVDNVQAVTAYVTADLRLSYRPVENLELSVMGQNLFDNQHPEQSSPIGLPTVEVPRGFYGKIAWRF